MGDYMARVRRVVLALPPKTIRGCLASMKSRIEAVVASRGQATKRE